jgi:regulatory protein
VADISGPETSANEDVPIERTATEAAGSAGDPLERALARAYRYLNRRDRTVAEMRAHLGRDGTDTAVVDVAVAALIDAGYLDDARYARLFAQDKRELEQWGSDRIRRALHERGIGRELVDEALAARQPESELERALELLRRRFPEPPRDRRERDRALGVLVRKGYDGELALDALAAYARETGARSTG